jgi:DNA replication protein DnaD
MKTDKMKETGKSISDFLKDTGFVPMSNLPLEDLLLPLEKNCR